MTAYYNEIDPFVAQWLRELIKAGMIVPGEVDERSIEDVIPGDLVGFTQCHFFAGIGGWSYALRIAGWPDDRPVWTGSCPCQPFSAAGKRKGFTDERHLWPSFWWLIRQCKPDVLFGEQVPSNNGRDWFENVASDLEYCGYRVGALITTAAGVACRFVRQRIFFVADNNSQRRENIKGWTRQAEQARREFVSPNTLESWIQERLFEPQESWVVDGLSKNVGAVRGLGNSIVPQQAKAFIKAYMS